MANLGQKIAPLKLGLQLQELGDRFTHKQRLGIYLTNTLDEALKKSEILFGQFVAQEANKASAIERDSPVMVVLGNHPYSGHSANTARVHFIFVCLYLSGHGNALSLQA